VTVAAAIFATACSPSLGTAAVRPQLVAEAQYVGDTLRAMGEPPIGHLAAGDQVFRFLWLRSFHPPFLVQVERRGEDRVLLVKALDSPWSASPDGIHVGTLALTQRKALRPDAWDRLAAMRREAFWGAPSSDPSAERGVDGAMWILEGRSWGEYHIVERWTPREGAFREMCLAMLDLSGLNLLAERIY